VFRRERVELLLGRRRNPGPNELATVLTAHATPALNTSGQLAILPIPRTHTDPLSLHKSLR
jgi:hypothetical protein